MDQLELSYVAGGTTDWFIHFGKLGPTEAHLTETQHMKTV